MAKVEKDFAELLRSFNRNEVRYFVVGAFAVGFHAVTRYSKDMDLLVEPSEENGGRICRALKEFGFGSLKIRPRDFASIGRFIQLGYEPVRVDLIQAKRASRRKQDLVDLEILLEAANKRKRR